MLEFTGERYIPWIDPEQNGVEIHYEHLQRYLFVLDFVKGKRVLDLGSGEGYGSYILASAAESVLGIELDQGTVEHARNTYQRPNLRFIHGSILDLGNLTGETFDIVVCFEVIEHIHEHEELLAGVAGAMRDDGILVISTPEIGEYSEKRNYQNPYHARELTTAEFLGLLQKHFRHVHLYGQRVISGSYVWDMACLSECRFSQEVVSWQNGHFDSVNIDSVSPMYLIAIASRKELRNRVQSFLLVDNSDLRAVVRDRKIADLDIEARNARNRCYEFRGKLEAIRNDPVWIMYQRISGRIPPGHFLRKFFGRFFSLLVKKV